MQVQSYDIGDGKEHGKALPHNVVVKYPVGEVFFCHYVGYEQAHHEQAEQDDGDCPIVICETFCYFTVVKADDRLCHAASEARNIEEAKKRAYRFFVLDIGRRYSYEKRKKEQSQEKSHLK